MMISTDGLFEFTLPDDLIEVLAWMLVDIKHRADDLDVGGGYSNELQKAIKVNSCLQRFKGGVIITDVMAKRLDGYIKGGSLRNEIKNNKHGSENF